MNVVLVTPAASIVLRASKFLLFRDNVQHHLQAGRPWPGYATIHEIADTAIGFGTVSPPAPELWTECSLAFAGLQDIAVGDLAMSIRTRGVLTDKTSLPAVRRTVLLRRCGWHPGLSLKGFRTLGDLFHEVISGMERVTLSGKLLAEVRVLAGKRRRLSSRSPRWL